MQHNIIVIGASDKVDALIAKFRNESGMQQTSSAINQLSSLGYREFYFKQGDVVFTLRHISTKHADNKFLHLQQINQQLPLANLCIACDTESATIEFLNLANKHSVGFILFVDGIDIIDEIKRKSSAKNIGSLVVEIEPISKEFIRKANKFELAVDSLSASAAAAATATSSAATSTCTLFAARVQLATSSAPQVPVVENAINDNHL